MKIVNIYQNIINNKNSFKLGDKQMKDTFLNEFYLIIYKEKY